MFDTNPMFARGLGHKQNLTAFNNLSIGRLALVMIATVLLNSTVLQKAQAREVDLDTLCSKFPLNSRCQGYKSPSRVAKSSAVAGRETSAAAEDATAVGQDPQVIKLKLKTSGPDNEWIKIEMKENSVKLLHTTRSNRGISQLFNGALGAVSPVPLPGFNFSKWSDHPTTRVVFEPDSCSLMRRLKHLESSTQQIGETSGSPSCTITGTDIVNLSEGMDIRSGRFSIEYQEGDLLRTITFRIPAEET